MIRKPMLAGKLEDLSQLKYPVYCTPKLDGIRALTVGGNLVSRSFKLIPNEHIRGSLVKVPDGVDGELVIPRANFNEISSVVMNQALRDDRVQYWAFDYVKDNPEKPYVDRIKDLISLKTRLINIRIFEHILPVMIKNENNLLTYEEHILKQGYEGVMIRNDGPYKFGRSTINEGYLLKLKRFEDSEAEIIGFIEQNRNDNPPEKDVLGYTKRSSFKSGQVAAGTLGSLYVRDLTTGIEFYIGSGFDQSLRDHIWNSRQEFMGAIVKYKHQKVGAVEAPRFPIFLGFRDERDM